MAYSTDEQKRIRAFYKRRITKYGIHSPRALAWDSKESQKARLETILELGNFDNKSVLDIGCGTGDLIPLLEERCSNFKYRGIDINADFITEAKKRYPSHNFSSGEFLCAKNKAADYIFASGVLTYKIDNYKERYFELVKEMFDSAVLGVAFNMLNEQHHSSKGLFATYSIPEVEGFCRGLTDKLIVRQDYLPRDFTVYLYH